MCACVDNRYPDSHDLLLIALLLVAVQWITVVAISPFFSPTTRKGKPVIDDEVLSFVCVVIDDWLSSFSFVGDKNGTRHNLLKQALIH